MRQVSRLLLFEIFETGLVPLQRLLDLLKVFQQGRLERKARLGTRVLVAGGLEKVVLLERHNDLVDVDVRVCDDDALEPIEIVHQRLEFRRDARDIGPKVLEALLEVRDDLGEVLRRRLFLEIRKLRLPLNFLIKGHVCKENVNRRLRIHWDCDGKNGQGFFLGMSGGHCKNFRIARIALRQWPRIFTPICVTLCRIPASYKIKTRAR